MAEVVAGSCLTFSLEVLYERIFSIWKFGRPTEVDRRLLDKLGSTLFYVKGVLNDAEKKQVSDSDIREWLQKLNNAIYNAEDVVDDIEALASLPKARLTPLDRLGDLILPWRRDWRPFVGADKITDILDTLEDIVKRKENLRLSEGVEPIITSCSTTWVKESDIYGRDDDKQAILDFLLSDDGHHVSVLPIVGMAGIGKTTLAQLVYNEIGHKVMQKPFEIKAWITVSVESDAFALTKAIYKEVTNSSESTIKETFKLQQKLRDFLKGKKFLWFLTMCGTWIISGGVS